MNNIIESIGEYTWKIPCKDAEHAGCEVTLNSGKPNGNPNAEELYNTSGKSGLSEGFIKFRAWDDKTGWYSEWKCSLESFIKVFATRCQNGEAIVNGNIVENS